MIPLYHVMIPSQKLKKLALKIIQFVASMMSNTHKLLIKVLKLDEKINFCRREYDFKIKLNLCLFQLNGRTLK